MDRIERLEMKAGPLRLAFEQNAESLFEELEKEDVEAEKVRMFSTQLKGKFDRLAEVQSQILDALLDEGTTNDYVTAFEECEVYMDMYGKAISKIDYWQAPVLPPITITEPSIVGTEHSVPGNKRNIKLPKLKLKKFDGEVRSWLGFWSQFKQIHADKDMTSEEKFQYLLQAMISGSRAASLVESFPPTADNYEKAIDQLTERFGRENLLVQVYVRDLLLLVIQRASGNSKNMELSTLYDKIESYLRALESLGRTKEKFADFLSPLVESCLPEDVLRTWERKRGDDKEIKDSAKNLESLMEFLSSEVNNEEMIRLASSGFGNKNKENPKSSKYQRPVESERVPTAATLFSSSGSSMSKTGKFEDRKSRFTQSCHFCSGTHSTQLCSVPEKLTLEEKRNILQSKGACFNCLKVGHTARDCRITIKCLMCGGKHCTILCSELPSHKSASHNNSHSGKGEKVNKESSSGTSTSSELTQLTVNSSTLVLLQTIVVVVENGPKRLFARVLIDNGSQRSYVSKSLIEKLQMKSQGEETVIHSLFGGVETEPEKHLLYKLQLESLDGKYRCHFQVGDKENICRYANPRSADVGKYLTEQGIHLPECKEKLSEIEILIGADVGGKLLTGQVEQLENGLVAVETRLGWTVMGKFGQSTHKKEDILVSLEMHNASVPTMTNLWKLDILGIQDPIEMQNKEELQQQALAKFKETVKILPDGRYEVELPWRNDLPGLPTNKDLAMKRHQNSLKKLEKEGRLKDYSQVLKNWEMEGIIEEVPESDLNSEKVHYLPHRPVYKEESLTTKIRPVFDASAHERGKPSLNDCLEKGANFIENIPDVLDRFRAGPIGVISDIEKAFLQLKVAPRHRNYLRFFGTEGQVYRHVRVVFGVISSPFLLGAVLDHVLEAASREFEWTTGKLRNAFYVDNCITSVNTPEELNQIRKEGTEILQRSCLNLRCWESNYYYPPTNPEVPVLGLIWDLGKDTIRCNLNHALVIDDVVTKRTILSTCQRIFDPIGVLCPITVLPKLLLRELWVQNKDWDDPLEYSQEQEFKTWKNLLPQVEQVNIPRYTGMKTDSEIHVFVDASKEAYATCIFLRSVSDGIVTVTLLRAKSRIAPTKGATIPRLELMACTIGARLANSIKKALASEMKITYWSDSATALCWIKNEGPWKIFVHNRVAEIRKLSQPKEWRFVPGNMNPADLPSRGCTASKLVESRWWEGPPWLKEPEDSWPSDVIHPTEDVEIERRKTIIDNLNTTVESCDDWYMRFSSYHRILRVMAWVIRFIDTLRNSKGNKSVGKIKKINISAKKFKIEDLTLAEIEKAEKKLFQSVQRESAKKLDKIIPESIVQDSDGIIKVRTRIINRKDDENFLYPILLPAGGS